METNKNKDIQWLGRLKSSYGYAAAFSLGLQDGSNLFSMSLALLFLFFLIYIVKSRNNIITCGCICIVAQFLVIYNLVQGIFDVLLSQDAVNTGIRLFFWLLAGIFLAIGIIYLRDWKLHRLESQRQDYWINAPVLEAETAGQQSNFFLTLITSIFLWILSFFFGGIIILLSSIASSDYNIFLMLLHSIQNQDPVTGTRTILTYGWGYILPTFCAWLMALLYFSSKKIRLSFDNRISLVKIICSSCFFAVGMGLVIVLFKF